MKLSYLPFIVFLGTFSLNAQSALPRLFYDVPSLSFVIPDVENVSRELGLNLETAMNFGTHWGVARVGGGVTGTLDPKAEDLAKSILVKPYTMLEAGLGRYRTNGDKCSRTNHNAYTIMAKGGLRYTFDTRKKEIGVEPDKTGYGLDYTVGAEFGYFFIRDVFKNMEVSLQSNYHIKAQAISIGFGYKLFLNLRADRG